MTGLPPSAAVRWRCLPFKALGAAALYRVLQLRAEVFVVEQACAFQDLDGRDAQALHLLGEAAHDADVLLGACAAEGVESENRPQRGQFLPNLQPHSPAMGQKGGEKWNAADGLQPTTLLPSRLLAYARLLPAGTAFAEASIGRVVTAPATRGTGMGHALMREAIATLQRRWGVQPIRIGAQAHLQAFYGQHGFVPHGEHYLEDGIDHIEMVRG